MTLQIMWTNLQRHKYVCVRVNLCSCMKVCMRKSTCVFVCVCMCVGVLIMHANTYAYNIDVTFSSASLPYDC